ncbi:sugar ABC transporter permease [Jatrophihabitans telluris]|uniref:Sugar ABC transporter permease n=1 Tax=Jatrophihabitans telluris TaxID=2038343 RepID=A0ABY4QWQ4_9ACTN|nr:sugar ABC transporter permease [Jatrophihabitans telluris]UQX87577.1 sugar ABC transporter permease [Jatrophihabitans telluris]
MTAATVDPGAITAPPIRSSAEDFKARMLRRAPLLPALIFTVIVTQLPFLYTLYISVIGWDRDHPEFGHKFVGLKNFRAVFSDHALREAVLVTVELTVLVVLVSLALGLVLALLLDRRFAGRGVVRTLLIAPFLIMPMAAALLWKHAFYNAQFGLINGVINGLRGWFGNHTPTSWSILTDHPLLAVAIPLIWQWTPFMMLILLAGLQSQPGDVLEAARVDGASAWQIFRTITLPHLRQYLELSVLLGSIYIIQAFDAIYTVTRGISNTTNLPFAIFETQTESGDYGVTSAEGVLVVFGTIVVATFALRVVSSLFKEEANS